MKQIKYDFPTMFKVYLAKEMDTYKNLSADELEKKAPQIYETWLNTPETALDGLSAREYFSNMTEETLLDAIELYQEEIPDALSDALKTKAKTMAPKMAEKLEDASPSYRMILIELLEEMHQKTTLPSLLAFMTDEKTEKLAADKAAEIVLSFSLSQKQIEMLVDKLLATQNSEIQDRLTDLLTTLNIQQVYDRVVQLLLLREDQIAFYATALSKLQDPRAITVLKQVLEDPTLNYYEYHAIISALERLGEFIDIDRDFETDEDAQYLASLYEGDKMPGVEMLSETDNTQDEE